MTGNSCSEDKASVHGTHALPNELNSTPIESFLKKLDIYWEKSNFWVSWHVITKQSGIMYISTALKIAL